jgi:hypothetical protein
MAVIRSWEVCPRARREAVAKIRIAREICFKVVWSASEWVRRGGGRRVTVNFQ